MPRFGDLFADLRGEDRTMRVSYHPDRDAVVLSLWSGTVCRGSFRMPVDDVHRLLKLLTEIDGATGTSGDPSGRGTATEDPAAGPQSESQSRSAPESQSAPAPTPERTGDLPGTTHRAAPPIRPAPRAA